MRVHLAGADRAEEGLYVDIEDDDGSSYRVKWDGFPASTLRVAVRAQQRELFSYSAMRPEQTTAEEAQHILRYWAATLRHCKEYPQRHQIMPVKRAEYSDAVHLLSYTFSKQKQELEAIARS